MKNFDLTSGNGRASMTAYVASLEHKLAEVKAELEKAKKTALDYMDSEGLTTLSAGGRTWKVIDRESLRLDSKLVESYCVSVGKDITELKKLSKQRYFQLCK